MLNSGEKAYCAALMALKRKDFMAASEYFNQAAPYFKSDKEFNLYYETTRLLVEVKKELGTLEVDDKLEIEEIFTNG
jgi:hypothetical protein